MNKSEKFLLKTVTVPTRGMERAALRGVIGHRRIKNKRSDVGSGSGSSGSHSNGARVAWRAFARILYWLSCRRDYQYTTDHWVHAWGDMNLDVCLIYCVYQFGIEYSIFFKCGNYTAFDLLVPSPLWSLLYFLLLQSNPAMLQLEERVKEVKVENAVKRWRRRVSIQIH